MCPLLILAQVVGIWEFVDWGKTWYVYPCSPRWTHKRFARVIGWAKSQVRGLDIGGLSTLVDAMCPYC